MGRAPCTLLSKKGIPRWNVGFHRLIVNLYVSKERSVSLLYIMQQKEEHIDLLAKFLRTCPDSITDVMVQIDTALHIALKFDNFETFKLLVRWLGSNWSKKAYAYEMKILKWRDEEGNTLLHVAISKNQTQASSLPASKMKIQTIVNSVLTKIQLIKYE